MDARPRGDAAADAWVETELVVRDPPPLEGTRVARSEAAPAHVTADGPPRTHPAPRRALRMRNTASATNNRRPGGCGEQRHIAGAISELRSAGRYSFDVEHVADDALMRIYRAGHEQSDLQLTREACIEDVRWPR